MQIRFSEEECHVLLTYTVISQTTPHLGSPGACLEGLSGVALHYTVNPFQVTKIFVDATPEFIEATFSHFDSDDIRDYVCDVMEFHCEDTFEYNNFTSSNDCKLAYDNLPKNISAGGYLDGKSKGCRILHSAFAAENSAHCPHLSFAPMQDKMGRTLCQESKGRKAADIFSQYELDIIAENSYKFGFPTSHYRYCQYDPDRSKDSPYDERPTLLRATDSIPLTYASDGQFEVKNARNFDYLPDSHGTLITTLSIFNNTLGIWCVHRLDYFSSFRCWDGISSLANISPRRLERRKRAEVARSSVHIPLA